MAVTPSLFSSALALLAWTTLFQNVAGQVTTSCQPLNTTNCPADPAFGMSYNFNFNTTPSESAWAPTVTPVTYDSQNGATFTINKQGDSPTIRSQFYIFFGRVEIWMKAASGTGIISSVMFLSDDLDEIDWEFMGGNHTYGETNYFGKGVQNFHNAIYYPVNGSIVDDFHNYTTHWTQDALQYWVDGQLVRTLLPKEANNSLYYPQTPMRISMGIWAGGDPSLPIGTREWAGGTTNYSEGPFTMQVRSAEVTDFSSGKQYVYGDQTGSWESIKIVSGNSTVADDLNAPAQETLSEKWNKLPQTSKTAVFASAAGAGALLVVVMAFYCIRQRRRGAKEARIAEAKYQEEQRELAAFKARGVDPDSFASETGADYDAKEMARDGLATDRSYSVPSAQSPTNEKWQGATTFGGASAAAIAAGGARSPMPLHDGADSPLLPGSAPQSPDYDRSLSIASPMRSGSPAVPPQQRLQQFQQPPSRSFSSPNAQMRLGSPGPQQSYGMQPLGAPQPHRSFTTGGYPAQGGASGGAGYRDGQSDQYWGHR